MTEISVGAVHHETTTEQPMAIDFRQNVDVVEDEATAAPPTVFELDNLEVHYGSFRAVLRCLNRMNDVIPSARVGGKITYHGNDLYGPNVSATEVRRRIGMVFQRPNPFPKSIYDNVAYGPKINGVRGKAKLDDLVEESLRGAALWDEVKTRLKSSALGMSGGQQQRLCIARAIAVQPEVILMDEPCSALDPIATARIEDLMQEIKSRFTIVIVTHNMQQAA